MKETITPADEIVSRPQSRPVRPWAIEVVCVVLFAVTAFWACGLLAGCRSIGHVKYTLTVLGTVNSLEIDNFVDEETPTGESLMTFDAEGVDVLGRFIDAIKDDAPTDPGPVEDPADDAT